MRRNLYIKIFSLSISLAVSQNDTTWIAKGGTLIDEGKYEKAATYFSEVINKNGNDKRPYYYRGLTFYLSKKTDQAIRDLNTALKIDSTFIRPILVLAAINYKYLNNDKKAIELFDKALMIDSLYTHSSFKRADIYFKRADYFEKIKNSRGAENDYLNTIKYGCDDLNKIAYLNLGLLYFDKKEYHKALDCANNAIKIDAFYFDAYSLRYDTYLQLDEFDKATADKKHLKSLKNEKIMYYCGE